MTAWVRSTLGAHPVMTPSSVTKMKRLGPDSPPLLTMKLLDALKTMPVGEPPPSVFPGDGMFTTNGFALPSPSYNVDTPESASATQTLPNGLKAMPHELTRLGSVCSAGMNPSDTRLR